MNYFLKFIFGTLFTVFTTSQVFAQPANDEPCTAIPLNVQTNCNYFSADNIAATNSS